MGVFDQVLESVSGAVHAVRARPRAARCTAAGVLLLLVGGAAAPPVLARDASPPGVPALPGPRAPLEARTYPRAAPDPGARLRASLEAMRGDVEGHLAVGAVDLTTGRSAVAGDEHAFACASIAKVNVLATLLLTAQREKRELTGREKDLAEAMIRRSDNKAADALWRIVGGADGMARADERLGLRETGPDDSGRWGLTHTTPADQLRLLQAVFTDDSPLDDASRTYLRGLMGEVAPEQAWGVSAAGAEGSAELKNGWLPRTATGLWVVNSIGRVEHDGHELLLVVLTDGQQDMESGVRVVERAARAAASAVR